MTILARRAGHTRVVTTPTFNQFLIDTYGLNDLIFLTDMRQIQGTYPTSVADLSGNGKTGTRAGTVTDVLGLDRNTYPDFADSSADITYGDHADFTISTTEGKTFVMLIRPTTTTQFQTLLYKQSGASAWEYNFHLNTFSSTVFKVSATLYASASGATIIRREVTNNHVVVKDAWNLIVLAFPPVTGTASDFDIYVNSATAEATTVTTSTNTGTGDTSTALRGFSDTPGGGTLDYEGAVARIAEIRRQASSTDVARMILALRREGWTLG